MDRKAILTEETILLVSAIKWSILASVAGIVIGVSTRAFLLVLGAAIEFVGSIGNYIYFLPVVFILSNFIFQRFGPSLEKNAENELIGSIHKRNGKISILVYPIRFVTTIITIAFGGSVGVEGPTAEMGGALSSFLSDRLGFDDYDRRKLVVCGVSAGFASVFGTPIAGALFGVEVLFLGKMMYDVLYPSFVAGIVSYEVVSWLGADHGHHLIEMMPEFTGFLFLKFVFAGIVFGLLSMIFVEIRWHFKKLFSLLEGRPYVKSLVGGVILIMLATTISSRPMGLGQGVMDEIFVGGQHSESVVGLEVVNSTAANAGGTVVASPADPILKMVYTSLTLESGGSGGILNPLFYIGATTGNLLGGLLGIDPMTMAAIGLVAMLAGAANTPISATVMAIELFGPEIGPMAGLACIVAFIMSGHRSVYPHQIIAAPKSDSIKTNIKSEVSDIHDMKFKNHRSSWAGKIIKRL